MSLHYMIRLLLVDDDPDLILAFETVLRSEFEVVSAHNGLDALEKLERVEPDLIVMDVMMPCLDGFDTAVSIRKNASFHSVPIIFLTALSDPASQAKGKDLSAALYLTKPFSPEELLERIRRVVLEQTIAPRPKMFAVEEILAAEREGIALELQPLAAPESEYGFASATDNDSQETPRGPLPRILVVDDEPDVVCLIESFLSPRYEVVTAMRAAEALEKIVETEPDLLLLDVEMPNLNGYQLSQLIKLNPALRQIRVMFVTSRSEPEQIDYGYRLGAAAYLTKPFTPEDLLQYVQRIFQQPGFVIREKKRTISELQHGRGKR
ncbi:MAG: response regulator [Candidatus Sumerlaeota bacterium]|nr:response regulator [Candidatus Sumerlaeota bacterium]